MKLNIKMIRVTFIFTVLLILPFKGLCTNKKQGFRIEDGSSVVSVTCLDGRTVHVQAYPKYQAQKESMVVDDSQFIFPDFKVISDKEKTALQTDLLRVEYDNKTKNISFFDKKTGKQILTERSRAFEPIEILNDKAYSISQAFSLYPDEAIYGLGQYQEGILNYRGQKANLVHANREIANPVLLSTNNYLIYWDNYSKTRFSDNQDGATFWSEVGDGISYYFIYGENMSDAIAGFRNLTGQAPMLPKSAFGFWMSKERYRSFDELTGVVAEYRKRNIPLDNIVQDWQYWGRDNKLWNSMEFNPGIGFDHPKEVIDDLHNKYNVKLTLSVWPGVGPATRIYQSLDSVGALFDVPTWAGYKVVDIYNPKAQNIYWKYLCAGLYSKGVDSWWMDAAEPSFKEGQYQDRQEYWSKQAGMTSIGTFARYLNTYSLVLSKILYNNLRNESNKRVSILTRSAFAGQQKYGTSTWSGDIYASWDVFKKQIPAGLNLCMTGIPYWTTDIGGFIVKKHDPKASTGLEAVTDEQTSGYEKGLQDPAYLELYTRWFQYAVFNPMFRAHGTDVPREIWHFGEPGTPFYDAQLDMINLRYSLLSYIYSDSWKVTSQGGTMMRALAMDFTSDKKVYDNAGGFMFGDALLVYPVTKPMYYDRNGKTEKPNTTISLYLPKHDGRFWYDLNSDKCYPAGTIITYNVPLNTIPVFAKAGTIVPRDQAAQYATAGDNSVMDIIIYSGKDATFTLYEDDYETYDYEKGLYSIIDIKWDEKKRELTFMAPKGELSPKMQSRTFNLKVYSPKTNGTATKSEKSVTYLNKEVTSIF
jgi:alpha-D-xyloside xylohydrolase